LRGFAAAPKLCYGSLSSAATGSGVPVHSGDKREEGSLAGDGLALLESRVGRAADWLAVSAALWAHAGVHPERGFHEELTLDGQPAGNGTTRVRVQARQTFSFALFAELAPAVDGLCAETACALVDRGLRVLVEDCRRPDGLYGRRMAYSGGLTDDTADLYDNAFVLLALSRAAALDRPGAAEAAAALADRIDRHFARPEGDEGFFELLPNSDVRLQNPHMHLFEASLAHHEAMSHPGSAARAEAIESLMARRFLTAEGGLREVFRSGWAPFEGDRLETGHQYEWVWLLHERARVLGGELNPAADGLYATALGLTGEAGAIYLEHHLSGSLKDSTRRCWGVTEAIKAHLARFGAGDAAAAGRAAASFDQLFDLFLDPAHVPGGWIDRYDGYANPLSQAMPASTGYHVYLALAEFLRVARAAGN